MALIFLRRLAEMLPMLMGITLICFLVIHLAPGDPATLMGNFDPKAHANAAMEAQLKSHGNLLEQYIHWVSGLALGDWGASLAPDGLPVLTKIGEALPLTLWMNGLGLLFTFFLCLPLGIWMALRPGGPRDVGMTAFLYLLLAAPGFWLGLLGMQFFGLYLGWVPLSGLSSYGSDAWSLGARLVDWGWHLALPLGIGLTGGLAGLTRFVRGSMVASLSADYVLTARAKGASAPRVVGVHALRNALLPVITILGLSVPGLIGGSVIMESLFALPGLGKLFYTAVMMRDYPVVMGLLTFGAALTLFGNLLADIMYMWADPRIRGRE